MRSNGMRLSVMELIFYGEPGEISTNIKEYQELGIIRLHLLQACMACINKLIFQKVFYPDQSGIFMLLKIVNIDSFCEIIKDKMNQLRATNSLVSCLN
jgi:hypothetical protein